MNNHTEMPEKLKIYTIEEIEKFNLTFSKEAYLGRFYRKDNTLYVFEKVNSLINSYLLKEIFED